MWFATEPNGWMAYINLCFSSETKAIEDDHVRAYLRENELSPRRVRSEEAGEVWQFGECYLGPHMRGLQALHWQGLVSDGIVRAVAKPLPEDAVWSLAETVIANNAAVPDQDDPSKLHLDEAFLQTQLAALS